MDIYGELGVSPVINGFATITVLGGSLMPREVLEAMNQAAAHFVDLKDFMEKACARIAQWTGNEAAFICDGAASGLALSAAALVVGDDPRGRLALPDSPGRKNELLVSRTFSVSYNHSLKLGGGRVVEYGSEEQATLADLENAITPRSAGLIVYYNEAKLPKMAPLSQQIALAHRHGLPVVIDAAAQIPPKSNLWRFTRELGAQLVIFSGGKGLRGPQASGLIVGEKQWIDRIRPHANPNMGIGRPMKVGKEEIAGLYAAIKRVLAEDEDALLVRYEDEVARAVEFFRQDPRVNGRRDFPSEAGQPMPRFYGALTCGGGRALDQALRSASPAIWLNCEEDGFYINPQTLEEGELELVLQGVEKALDAAHAS